MRNITIQKYTRLADTTLYDNILQHLRPRGNFAGRQMSITAMPYANVKYCIRLMPKITGWNGVVQLFAICFDVDEKTFWRTGVTEYFAARNYIIAELERVVSTENSLFASANTDAHLWKMAGAARLEPYTDTLPLVQLGRLLGQYPFDLGRRPYGEIFSLLVQTRLQNEIEHEYHKLQAG